MLKEHLLFNQSWSFPFKDNCNLLLKLMDSGHNITVFWSWKRSFKGQGTKLTLRKSSIQKLVLWCSVDTRWHVLITASNNLCISGISGLLTDTFPVTLSEFMTYKWAKIIEILAKTCITLCLMSTFIIIASSDPEFFWQNNIPELQIPCNYYVNNSFTIIFELSHRYLIIIKCCTLTEHSDLLLGK